MDPWKIGGIFDDDGYEIIPNHIRKPSLCLVCLNNSDPGPEDDILCNLTRQDQRKSENFICYAYIKMQTTQVRFLKVVPIKNRVLSLILQL